MVIPCYNEAATIKVVLERVLGSPYTSEAIVIDDCSTDGSREVLTGFVDPRVRVLLQPFNQGKGAALRRGFREAQAPFVVVQDADLEYDPADYDVLLQPLLSGQADVVYGSRFHAWQAHRVLYYWHSVGNRVLTTISNMFTNLNLTDMETCYKAFRREVIQAVELEEDRFGFEPEITAKLAAAQYVVYEVGISYAGRTYSEGKKIGWRDGLRALYCIVRYSPPALRRRRRRSRNPAEFTKADAELREALENLEDAGNYADWIRSEIVGYLGDRVLEVGAGHGAMTDRLSEHAEVTAVELSPRAADMLRTRFAGLPNVRVFEGGLDDLPSPGGSYDSAVLVNVLEHIPDDDAALARLATCVRPGGHVVVWAPAFEALYSRFDHEIGHFRRYRRRELTRKAAAAGLEPVDVRYVNSVGAIAWLVVARALQRRPTNSGSVRLFDRFVVPVLRHLEPRNVPFGQSLLGVFRRPACED